MDNPLIVCQIAGAVGHALHGMHVTAKCNVCACAHVCMWEVVVCGDSRPLPGHLVPVTTLVSV